MSGNIILLLILFSNVENYTNPSLLTNCRKTGGGLETRMSWFAKPTYWSVKPPGFEVFL